MHPRFAFRAHDGSYVCAEGGGGREVVANRPAVGPWETFVVIPLPNDFVGLMVANGQYVCAEGGGGREVVANRGEIGPWETFSWVWLEGGTQRGGTPAEGDIGRTFALMASNGQFVCAEGGGGGAVVANRHEPGPWETFTTVAPPAG
jgi:hypothetical protein